jgi:hypothetical protein
MANDEQKLRSLLVAVHRAYPDWEWNGRLGVDEGPRPLSLTEPCERCGEPIVFLEHSKDDRPRAWCQIGRRTDPAPGRFRVMMTIHTPARCSETRQLLRDPS